MGTTYCLPASQIECYTFGSCQSAHEVLSCLTGLLKLLGKFYSLSILDQIDIDQIMNGEVPSKWTNNKHFGSNRRHIVPLDVPCICGPWYRHVHFVTFILCPQYRTFLDPLTDTSVIRATIHENVKNAIKSSHE